MTDFHVYRTSSEVGKAAAAQVVELAHSAVQMRGKFTLALSGGSLPQILFPHLTSEPFVGQVDWSAWHVAWADERVVPLTDPDSNYRLARELLFDLVPIPSNQIFALNELTFNEAGSPAVASAIMYERQLAGLFQLPPNQLPRFDLILLGMGPDGHIASLFPNHPLLEVQDRWVAAIEDSPKPPPGRITFTLPLINAARHVLFVVTGANKQEKVHAVRELPPAPETPASLVNPSEGALYWFVDEAAGGAPHVDQD